MAYQRIPSARWLFNGPQTAWRACRVLFLALLLGAVPASVAFAQVPIRLAWDANSDGMTAGYRVLVRSSAGVSLGAVDVGNATSAVIPLAMGNVYFLSVAAYTNLGAVGPPSNQLEVDLAAAPGAPANFGANVSGATAVLGWSAPASGGSSLNYLLSVGTGPGASNLLNGYRLGDTRSVSGTLAPGTYFARLHAANFVGVGPASREVSFQIGGGQRPASPSGLGAAWAGTVVRLSWAPPAVSGAQLPTSYIVEAGASPGSASVGSFNVGNTTSFSIDVPPGTYYVRVRGVNAAGVSDPSNEIVVQGQGAPGAARQLVASVSGAVVSLRWSTPQSGAQATSYVIEAGTGPGLSNLTVANVGNVTSVATTVPPGTYYVRVRAANGRGLGAPSNEVVVRR